MSISIPIRRAACRSCAGGSLKGLLLEELALILPTLEPARQAFRHTTAEHLFGTPGQPGGASLSFHDGRLPGDLRAAIERNG